MIFNVEDGVSRLAGVSASSNWMDAGRKIGPSSIFFRLQGIGHPAPHDSGRTAAKK